jgi:hypothetical protein
MLIISLLLYIIVCETAYIIMDLLYTSGTVQALKAPKRVGYIIYFNSLGAYQ